MQKSFLVAKGNVFSKNVYEGIEFATSFLTLLFYGLILHGQWKARSQGKHRNCLYSDLQT